VTNKTFSNLIVGDNNEFAHDMCRYIATLPQEPVGPLLLIGASGTGKSHLLNAVSIELATEVPGTRVLHLDKEKLLDQVIEVDFNHQIVWVNAVENYDVLLFDDLEQIIDCFNSEWTLRELVYRFLAKKKPVVLTITDNPETFEEVSCAMGLIFKKCIRALLCHPDAGARESAIEYFEALHEFSVPLQKAKRLKQSAGISISEIKGAVLKTKLARTMTV